MSSKLEVLTPEQQAEVIAKAKELVRSKLELEDMQRFGIQGAIGGAAGYGLYHLGNTIAKALNPPSSSYTAPVEAVVYTPDREKKRRGRRKAAAAPLGTASSGALGGPYTPVDQMRTDNPRGLAAALLATAIGIPTGIYAAKRLTQGASRVARHRELEQAQREFERALQEYAESGDRPKKIEKRAQLDGREAKIAELAENCYKLALWKELPAWYLAYAAGTGLLGAGIGFNQSWENRAAKDLSIAERMLNQQRERVNPTFTVAKLKDPPDLDKKPADEQEAEEMRRQIRESIEEVVDNFDTDYL